MSLSTGTRLGPYEVVELLGAGGMGEVFRARDTRLGRDVAVKVLPERFFEDEERHQRFEREAKCLASLNHPNILSVFDVGRDDGTPYVVTEFLEGESLREVVSRRSPTLGQALGWGAQVARGLAAAHEKGIVHRDLKPENLFLTADARIKLLDFGLAKFALAETAPAATNLTTEPALTDVGTALGTVAYMSPEQVLGHPLDGRSDLFSFGVVLYELLARRHPFRRETEPATLGAILQDTPPPLMGLDATIPRAVDAIVGRCLEKRREDRFESAHDLALALEAVLERPSETTALLDVAEKCPYPGLSSFTEEDADRFFGREEEVEALWMKLRSRRMMGVIGPSGAGKTSFVRAGLVARRPAGWSAVVSTPGRAPLRGLGQALGPQLARDPEALRKIAGFEDPDTAFELLVRWRRSHERALVVVDQFEELFTLNDTETQARFAVLLGRLVGEADVHVLLSMRDDFLMRCHDHAALAPVFEALTPLGAMTRDGLRRALVEPARKQGYQFEEDALVDEVIASVEGARGALPLLAFAMSRLWERRDRKRRVLTRESYGEIGGVSGALAQHAEATMDGIGAERQGLVRDVFRNLVTAQGTRCVLDREELLSAFSDRSAAEAVLRQLVDSRLLTSWDLEAKEGEPGHQLVEIVHESLLTAWPRLVRWRTQDADGAQLRDQLRQAAHLWKERNEAEDVLWTGGSYLEYRAWRESYPGGLSSVEEEFAKAMTTKARRKRRLMQVAAVAALIVSTGVAIAIGVSRHKAVVAAQRAEASKLLALAQLKLQEDPTEALAYATASLEVSDTKEARLFALRSLQEAPPAWEMKGVGIGKFPRFSPDGRHLAVGNLSAEVGVWSEDGDPPVRLPGEINSDAIWASDEILVTGVAPGVVGDPRGFYSDQSPRHVHVWSMPSGKELRAIDFGAAGRWQVGPDRLFAEVRIPSSSKVVDLRSWRLPDGESEELGTLNFDELGATTGMFEPWGRFWFYTAGSTTRVLSLPVASRSDRVFSHHRSRVTFNTWIDQRLLGQHEEAGENRLLAFGEEGKAPITTFFSKPRSAPPSIQCTSSQRWLSSNPEEDSRLRFWDTKALSGARPLELRREGSWYGASSSLDPSGRLAVASTANMRRLTFWPMPQRAPSIVDGYKGMARPVAFSPDGKWLATSWSDNQIRLWPLPGSGRNESKPLTPPTTEVLWRSLAFDPSGRYLFAVGTPDVAWVVPLDGSDGRKFQGSSQDTILMGAAVSPSGRRVAATPVRTKEFKKLRVWDVETGMVRMFDLPHSETPPGGPSPTGHEGGILSIAFLDESALLTAGDGGIRRWNIETGTNVLMRATPRGQLAEMCLSSDRREVYFCEIERGPLRTVSSGAIDLATGAIKPLPGSPDLVTVGFAALRLATQGTVLAVLGGDGSIRVGPRAGGEQHRLLGHKGTPQRVAISPDLRWIASTGEDNTLRLWPMPDLSKPPLHTLPHDELLAKLKSLTNVRAVRDASSESGWKIELGPFPGWKNLPEWPP